MDALCAIDLDQYLNIIRNAISGVQTAVCGWFVADLEEIEDLGFGDTGAGCREGGEALVGLVAGFIDDCERKGGRVSKMISDGSVLE